MKSFLDKLAEGGKHIKGSELGLYTLVTEIIGQSAQHGSASKKKADTPRYHKFLKAGLQSLIAHPNSMDGRIRMMSYFERKLLSSSEGSTHY